MLDFLVIQDRGFCLFTLLVYDFGFAVFNVFFFIELISTLLEFFSRIKVLSKIADF